MNEHAVDATVAMPFVGSSSMFLALLPIKAAMLAASFVACLAASGVHAQQGAGAVPALAYDAQTRGPVPIPPFERSLQTVVAEPWFKVSDESLVLEGPAFERDGNLLFCDVSGKRVLRLTSDRRLSTVINLDQLAPGGLAVHKDGRVFIAAIDIAWGSGAVMAVQPDGSGVRAIVPPQAGFMLNDLVFDARGEFYFTDFRCASTDPKGGVYYVPLDLGTITPVLPRLAMANGVALSPDGKELWTTESSRNLLHRVELANATTAMPFGTAIAYHFTGPASDSMCVDSDGNLYVATATFTWPCTARAVFWPSPGTVSPSARCCCPAERRATTCARPAWPSGPAPTTFTS